MDKLVKEFQQPSAAFRGKPFWAWNGKLEEGELRRQIRIMHAMGLGGYFMHSRVGLDTEYLGKEWFQLVNACIDEGNQLGMESWLYDEDRWPSGAAGGLVTKNPRFRQKALKLQLADKAPAKAKGILACFQARLEKDQAVDVAPLAYGKKADKGKTALVFSEYTYPCSDWYNGAAYLDTLSHDAVKQFIAVTHQAYAKHCGKYFGGRVPGIFTDEPNHGSTLQGGLIDTNPQREWCIPWTDQLPKVFRQRYGYDLLKHLPEVFFDVDGQATSQARVNYHDCKTFLFVDAFARQIGEWCEKHKISHTGHVLEESTPSQQTNVVGSAMRFYEHMQAPGVDVLTQFWPEYDTVKQCASVLHQTGRKWLLSELYGTTGWDFSFAGHKRVGDWQAVLGVNLRCQHLSWYTMLGEAKRDYPASMLHHSPWWQHYQHVEDYFSRVGVLMTRGEPVRPLLVIHPLESTWARCRVGWGGAEDIRKLNENLAHVRDYLLDSHIDFDYGDEEMLSRLAKVSKGKQGASLALGKAQYAVVLVPPMLTIRQSTLELLEKFRKAGGQVVFVGEPAKFVQGAASDAPAKVAASCQQVPFDKAEVTKAVMPARKVSILAHEGHEYGPALYMLRREGNQYYLFVVNRSGKHGSGPLKVTVNLPGVAQEWDPVTGERYLADCSRTDQGLTIDTELSACGSRLFVIGPKQNGLKPRIKMSRDFFEALDNAEWEYQLDEPNALVLDRPAFKVGNVQWQPADEVLRVDRAVRKAAGLPHRGGGMVQPWARKPTGKPPINLTLRYRFEVDEVPGTALTLAFETPERFDTLKLNGQPISLTTVNGWWVDKAIQTLPVDPAVLVIGENIFELTMRYNEHDGLEAMFLLGDFGVRLEGTTAVMQSLPTTLKVGDICGQGLPFYTGAVTYVVCLEVSLPAGERAVLEIPQFAGACIRVLGDGKPLGLLGWPPYELDITELVADGKEHELAIQLVGTRRNSFGPLHLVNPDPAWTGPGEFITQGEGWRDDYHLKPAGLLAPPVISQRRVKLGKLWTCRGEAFTAIRLR